MSELRILNSIALVLLILSALNWGSVSLFNFDTVDCVGKFSEKLAKLIYFLFGAAAVYGGIISLKIRARKQ